MKGNDRTSTIALEYPVEWEGGVIDKVTIRRPKTREMRAITAAQAEEDDRFENSVFILALLSDLPKDAIDELDVADFTALSEALGDFFPKGRQADGEASAPTAPTS